MAPQTCPCGQELRDATLCAGCTHALQVACANIAAHHKDLDTIRAKLTRYSDPDGRTGPTRSLVLDLRFADRKAAGTVLEHRVHNTVTTWVRYVAEHYRTGYPPDDITARCAHLLAAAPRLRVDVAGPEILDELQALADALALFVDSPAERWYAGPCDTCGADVYAVADEALAACAVCGATYQVAERRAHLLAAAEDRLETPAVIARALTTIGNYQGGEERIADRIRKWAGRARIQVRGEVVVSGQVRKLYRIGDVLDLLAADTRHAARAA